MCKFWLLHTFFKTCSYHLKKKTKKTKKKTSIWWICNGISHYGFNLHFPEECYDLSRFTYTHYPFEYPCLWNDCLSSLFFLNIQLSAFYLRICSSYLYILDIILFLDVYAAIIFSQLFLLDLQILFLDLFSFLEYILYTVLYWEFNWF